ncbi:putative olfactory receptor 2B8 [Equus przewalskii]|uniref:Olfactory receptor n=1 Tax=Equus przewalskii TaxID=9798 RepID=A0ABM4LHT7_EQUPR|nr:PREDICTED: putative olfactory receptor 2B8 [Equus przewalskii]
MEKTNDSTFSGFILLGFSGRPQLETTLFVVILIIYFLSSLGNGTIILLSVLDPRLHTPLYFFLSNLSFMDLCLTTCTDPQTLANFKGKDKIITYGGCVTQLFISLGLGGTECVLLSVMAYDRYAAVCRPLHYMVIMHPQLCLQLTVTAWFTGFGSSVVQTALTMTLPLCGKNQVDHFFCEVPVMLKLACTDTSIHETEMFTVSVFFLVVPLSFILISYGHITSAVLKMKSAQGRRKAFGTCGSHLMVVIIFFGTLISMYLQPPSSYLKDMNKSIALFYTLVTPLLNPLIYSLRNKDVKGALRRLVRTTIDRERANAGLAGQSACAPNFSVTRN